MRLAKTFRNWALILGVFAVLGSCGKTGQQLSTETNWLSECSDNSECGGLACLCGVCSQSCTSLDDCTKTPGATRCSAPDDPSECAAEALSICLPERGLDAADGTGGGSRGNDSGSVSGAAGSSGTGAPGPWQLRAALPEEDEGLSWYVQALALDADTAVLGGRDTNDDVGTALVFVRDGDDWSQQAELLQPPGYGSFGESLALHGDTLLVGAPEDGEGSVHVYVREDGEWSAQQILRASDGQAGAEFGDSLALQGDRALVGGWAGGDGAAYVFVRDGSVWTEEARLVPLENDDNFGRVALDGDTALVSGWSNGAGAVYFFVRDDASWSLQQRLLVSDGMDGDPPGVSAVLYGDTALVDARHASGGGAVHVFAREGSVWSLQQRLTGHQDDEEFGWAMSLGDETALIASTNFPGYSGAAYVFVREGSEWLLEQRWTSPGCCDGFGDSLALSGNTVIIAAPGRAGLGSVPPGCSTCNEGEPSLGSAYVFTLGSN